MGILDLAGRMGRAAAGYGASEPALTLSIPGNGAKWVDAGSLSARVSSFGIGLKGRLRRAKVGPLSRLAAYGTTSAGAIVSQRRRFAPLDLLECASAGSGNRGRPAPLRWFGLYDS